MSIRPTSSRNSSRTVSNMPYNARPMSKRVYVGNIPWDLHWQVLKDHCKQAGTVTRADVMTDPITGKSKGYGIVEYATIQEAENAIEILTGTSINGRPIHIREDREDRDAKVPGHGQPQVYPQPHSFDIGGAMAGRKVFVGNLSFDVTWQELKDVMKQVAPVLHADISTDPTGRSKGYGVVEFASSEGARKAIACMGDTEIKGRKIFIREDREESKSHSNINPGFPLMMPNAPYGMMQNQGFNPQFSAGMIYASQMMAQGHQPSHGWQGHPPHGQPLHGHQPHGHGHPPSRMHSIPPPSVESEGLRHIGKRLYVGNLAYDVTWQELKDHFKEVVPVVRVEVSSNKEGKSRGFGMVELSSTNDAITAIGRLNSTNLKGRMIFVREDRDEGKA